MNKLMKVKKEQLTNIKKDEKGFTLIEMVIVLVIIAILAAVLVPSMSSWIDNARERTCLTEARNGLTAITAELGNKYAVNGTVAVSDISWDKVADKMGIKDATEKSKVNTRFTDLTVTATGEVTSFTYHNNSHQVEYNNGKFEEVEKYTPPAG